MTRLCKVCLGMKPLKHSNSLKVSKIVGQYWKFSEKWANIAKGFLSFVESCLLAFMTTATVKLAAALQNATQFQLPVRTFIIRNDILTPSLKLSSSLHVSLNPRMLLFWLFRATPCTSCPAPGEKRSDSVALHDLIRTCTYTDPPIKPTQLQQRICCVFLLAPAATVDSTRLAGSAGSETRA